MLQASLLQQDSFIISRNETRNFKIHQKTNRISYVFLVAGSYNNLFFPERQEERGREEKKFEKNVPSVSFSVCVVDPFLGWR